MSADGRPGHDGAEGDLRTRVATLLLDRAAVITADAAGLYPHTAGSSLDHDYGARLAQALIRLLAIAVREARVDPRGGPVATLRAAVLERSIEPEQLFALAYLTERSALDDLAFDGALGATSEAWPVVAQLVRRASFDYLGAFIARGHDDPTETTITDSLTTLHTRTVFDAVLLKESERSGRLGHSLALILFDVDRLSAINERHGYGVGNRILERIAILMRRYFRQSDWVARYRDDEIAVLLTGGDAEHAGDLAERARAMVEQRLGFTDHRNGTTIKVTISGAVVTIPGLTATLIDPERLLVEAEDGVARAKGAGRNRIESVSGSATSRALPRNSPSA